MISLLLRWASRAFVSRCSREVAGTWIRMGRDG
jgi:hypothetical protein